MDIVDFDEDFTKKKMRYFVWSILLLFVGGFVIFSVLLSVFADYSALVKFLIIAAVAFASSLVLYLLLTVFKYLSQSNLNENNWYANPQHIHESMTTYFNLLTNLKDLIEKAKADNQNIDTDKIVSNFHQFSSDERTNNLLKSSIINDLFKEEMISSQKNEDVFNALIQKLKDSIKANGYDAGLDIVSLLFKKAIEHNNNLKKKY